MDDPVGRRDIAVFIDMENLFGGWGRMSRGCRSPAS